MAIDNTPGAKASGRETVAESNEDVEDIEETEGSELENEEAEGEETAEADADEQEGDEDADAEADDEDGEDEKPEDAKRLSKSARRREATKARISTLEEIARREADRADAADRFLKSLTDELGAAPKREQYQDNDEFIADLAAYKADQRALARQKKSAELNTKDARDTATRHKDQLFRERTLALSERFPDIEAKVLNDASLPISPVMAEVIRESDRGPEVAYYLATHREEASRIQGVSLRDPLAAARELGRIEATLSAPKPKTVTKAPKPAPTLGGRSSAAAKNPDRMTMDEWLEWRNAQLRRKAS